MKKSLVPFIIFLFLVSSVFASDGIVGGERVTEINEVPYMVSLSGICGGSIISKRWLLTAAHCAGYFSQAKAGILNLKEQGQKFRVKRVLKHPQYNRSTFGHDVALVELTDEIDFAQTGLSPILLASPEFAASGNQDAGLDSTVYGFGDIENGQWNMTKDLHKVTVPIVSREEANRAESYNGKVDETMLAAGYAMGGKDSCQGDSGGPLVVFDRQNRPVQIGVVSWGEGCADANKFGIYSKVSHSFNWIQKTIEAD